VTWIAGNFEFTVHSGAGVYAMKNPPFTIGLQEANLDDQPTFVPIVKSLLAFRKLLPPDLLSWSTCNFNSRNTCSLINGINANLPFDGRCYGTLRGSQFVAVCVDDVLTQPLTAARPMTIDVYDPEDARLVKHLVLGAGQPLNLGGGVDAYVVVGR
jgi:hypothetical protein